MDLVSLYIDQVHPRDVGLELAREHNITVYPSIRGALTLTPTVTSHWPTGADFRSGELAVDGVLIIGEHGDYAGNERQRQMYPRRHFFEAGLWGLCHFGALRARIQRQAPGL